MVDNVKIQHVCLFLSLLQLIMLINPNDGGKITISGG